MSINGRCCNKSITGNLVGASEQSGVVKFLVMHYIKSYRKDCSARLVVYTY